MVSGNKTLRKEFLHSSTFFENRPRKDTMTLEKSDYDAVICGAGITGIAAGVKLGEAGFNYLVVESLDGPGGVWVSSGPALQTHDSMIDKIR